MVPDHAPVGTRQRPSRTGPVAQATRASGRPANHGRAVKELDAIGPAVGGSVGETAHPSRRRPGTRSVACKPPAAGRTSALGTSIGQNTRSGGAKITSGRRTRGTAHPTPHTRSPTPHTRRRGRGRADRAPTRTARTNHRIVEVRLAHSVRISTIFANTRPALEPQPPARRAPGPTLTTMSLAATWWPSPQRTSARTDSPQSRCRSSTGGPAGSVA